MQGDSAEIQKSKNAEDPLPSMFWGLDPIHGVFAKLYIKDILELKKSCPIPGVFFYKTHPITKVDILGIIVQKREREKSVSFGVDDGTGVISCLCWKKQRALENIKPAKIADPVFTAQIARMLELPYLYRNFYDKTSKISTDSTEPNQQGGKILSLQMKIKQFLNQTRVKNFYQQELEAIDSLVCIAQQNQETPCVSRQIHEVFQEAVCALQEEGVIFQKVAGPSKLYLVTDEEKELHNATLRIIQDDSTRPKHVEKGCPFLHIVNCVRHSYSAGVSEAAVQRVLDRLECNSEIVSTMDRHYTAA
ncbi:CST complex subunit STN1 isoform X2 [Hemiscyllium ocellatum]|uniref:CST complex subunit STN1 isoform X2 n=1 Tax=Hemiscyllium ocellatum TaxID=170820 RepID=UPI002966DBC4|nr:CST complex subunit STN1 isoform X2 [Hemiscyllium ocellatum]